MENMYSRFKGVEPIEIPTLDMREPGKFSHSLTIWRLPGNDLRTVFAMRLRYDPGYRKRYGVSGSPGVPGTPKSGHFDTAELFSLSEPNPRCRVSILPQLSPKSSAPHTQS